MAFIGILIVVGLYFLSKPFWSVKISTMVLGLVAGAIAGVVGCIRDWNTESSWSYIVIVSAVAIGAILFVSILMSFKRYKSVLFWRQWTQSCLFFFGEFFGGLWIGYFSIWVVVVVLLLAGMAQSNSSRSSGGGGGSSSGDGGSTHQCCATCRRFNGNTCIDDPMGSISNPHGTKCQNYS